VPVKQINECFEDSDSQNPHRRANEEIQYGLRLAESIRDILCTNIFSFDMSIIVYCQISFNNSIVPIRMLLMDSTDIYCHRHEYSKCLMCLTRSI
jgi:hypothetical protein